VAQVYVHAASSRAARPEQELRAFSKVDLAPEQEREVLVNLPPRAFAYFDEKENGWRVEPGDYEIRASSSSRDVRLRAFVTVPNRGRALMQ
jgi:beta-glucosidase